MGSNRSMSRENKKKQLRSQMVSSSVSFLLGMRKAGA